MVLIVLKCIKKENLPVNSSQTVYRAYHLTNQLIMPMGFDSYLRLNRYVFLYSLLNDLAEP